MSLSSISHELHYHRGRSKGPTEQCPISFVFKDQELLTHLPMKWEAGKMHIKIRYFIKAVIWKYSCPKPALRNGEIIPVVGMDGHIRPLMCSLWILIRCCQKDGVFLNSEWNVRLFSSWFFVVKVLAVLQSHVWLSNYIWESGLQLLTRPPPTESAWDQNLFSEGVCTPRLIRGAPANCILWDPLHP